MSNYTKLRMKKGSDMNIKSFFTIYNYFAASFYSFLALNAGALEALILIVLTYLYIILTNWMLKLLHSKKSFTLRIDNSPLP